MGDYGLAHPLRYLAPRFVVWVKSNYQVFPDGKAYDDQPKALLDDFNAMLTRLGQIMQQLTPKK